MNIPLTDNARCLSLISCGVLCAGLLSAEEPKVKQRVQLQAAQPQRVKQLVQVQAAGGAQVVVRGGWGQGAWDVREEVDRNNSIERFLLLLPGGPVIVQATMTIDGQPYQVRRETLIDEMLAVADTDGDGKPTWDEALAAPRFTLGQVRIANALQQKQFLTALDRNSDGIVDRVEVRRFIAQYSQGPAFVVGGLGGGGRWGGGAIVVANGQVLGGGTGSTEARGLIDEDGDGTLSPVEVEQAGDRLKGRDADDNDLLYAAELGGTAAGGGAYRVVASAPGPRMQVAQNAVLLGPEVKAESLFAALQQKYRTTDNGPTEATAFAGVPGLFEQLDVNRNSRLDADEVLALNTLPAQIELAVMLGEPAGEAGLTVTSVGQGIPDVVTTADSSRLEFPGAALQFDTKSPVQPMINYAQTGKQYLTQYDKDGNQYLEKSELPDQFAPQFEVWDEDADGKVYEQEIVASYTRMMAPQLSQVRANVTASGDPLFGILDQTGDGRLSLREMKTAPERIRTLDRDGDGRVTKDEVPESWSVAFGVGYAQYSAYRVGQAGVASQSPAPRDGTPEWFTRMDRNGDGDVTLREFLGGRAKFEELDTNHDGFLEAGEAAAAGAEASSQK
jgi:Ca2+-binding EF-hand superfamily protein